MVAGSAYDSPRRRARQRQQRRSAGRRPATAGEELLRQHITAGGMAAHDQLTLEERLVTAQDYLQKQQTMLSASHQQILLLLNGPPTRRYCTLELKGDEACPLWMSYF